MCQGDQRRVKTLINQELHLLARRFRLTRRGGRLAQGRIRNSDGSRVVGSDSGDSRPKLTVGALAGARGEG